MKIVLSKKEYLYILLIFCYLNYFLNPQNLIYEYVFELWEIK